MLKEFMEMSNVKRLLFVEKRLGVEPTQASKIANNLFVAINPEKHDSFKPKDYFAEALKLIQKNQKPFCEGLGDLIEEIEEAIKCKQNGS